MKTAAASISCISANDRRAIDSPRAVCYTSLVRREMRRVNGYYWRKTLRQMRDVRMLVLAGMLCALRIVLESFLCIPLGPNLEFSLAYLPNALTGLLCGPVVALVSGAVTDVLSWLLVSKGPFFPLFTLLEMFSSCVYALFLYGRRATLPRCVLCKGTINLVSNVFLTSLLLSCLYGKAVSVYMAGRIVKNAVLWLPESLLLFALLQGVRPAMRAMGLGDGKISSGKEDARG